MLRRRAAERPQGILQTFRQGDEALAAQHHVGMLEAGIGQTEVIQAMIQRGAGGVILASAEL